MLLGMVSTSFCSGRHVALCLSLHSHRCEIGFWENVRKKVRFVEDVGGFTGMPVCLCSFLMMDVHICFIFTPIWARLPS